MALRGIGAPLVYAMVTQAEAVMVDGILPQLQLRLPLSPFELW
jgi:hypothetical protein